MKEKTEHQNKLDWGHKVLRVVHNEPIINKINPVQVKESIDQINMDDLQYEYEALNMDGWRYQMGFALDDDSFYLFYKKPLDNSK